jgi:hypothetical protein
MKLTRVVLISLACVGGAFVCGIVANLAIDLVMPATAKSRVAVAAASAPPVAQPAAAAEEASIPTAFVLASATSVPTDIAPIKVKTVPLVAREPAEAAPAPKSAAAIPLPRPRPANAPDALVGSIAQQPAAMAIAAATRTAPTEDNDPLSPANIDRIKMALALTSEQEEFWPAVAAELRALGKLQQQRRGKKGQFAKIDVDPDTMQRLYWAAAPLITRLSYDQKQAVKQLALSMGLEEVAQAL